MTTENQVQYLLYGYYVPLNSLSLLGLFSNLDNALKMMKSCWLNKENLKFSGLVYPRDLIYIEEVIVDKMQPITPRTLYLIVEDKIIKSNWVNLTPHPQFEISYKDYENNIGKTDKIYWDQPESYPLYN